MCYGYVVQVLFVRALTKVLRVAVHTDQMAQCAMTQSVQMNQMSLISRLPFKTVCGHTCVPGQSSAGRKLHVSWTRPDFSSPKLLHFLLLLPCAFLHIDSLAQQNNTDKTEYSLIKNCNAISAATLEVCDKWSEHFCQDCSVTGTFSALTTCHFKG